METTKLIAMVPFILEIDRLTTKEFCQKYGIEEPRLIRDQNNEADIRKSADQFLQIDAIKHRIFVEYAKLLNKPITEQMFTGVNAIFPGFVKCTQSHAVKNGIEKSFDNFGHDEYQITLQSSSFTTEHENSATYTTHMHLKKVIDLTPFNLDFNSPIK